MPRFALFTAPRLANAGCRDSDIDGLVFLLRPLSGVLRALILAAAVATTLNAYGGWHTAQHSTWHSTTAQRITAFDFRSFRDWQQPLQAAFRPPCLLLAASTPCRAAGINVGPLVASVGGIGVVLGLASQRVMATTFAAITLVGVPACCACCACCACPSVLCCACLHACLCKPVG